MIDYDTWRTAGPWDADEDIMANNRYDATSYTDRFPKSKVRVEAYTPTCWVVEVLRVTWESVESFKTHREAVAFATSITTRT